MRDVAADRAAVANCGIAHLLRSLGKCGALFAQHTRRGEISVRGERANSNDAVLRGHAPELGDPADVDQGRWGR